MAQVMLIYDKDCPNVRVARSNLLKAFAEAGMPARWDEVDRGAADAPAEWRGFASPTLLIEGRDAAGMAPNGGDAACRLYEHAGVRSGSPSVDMLVAALTAAAVPVAPVSVAPAAPLQVLSTMTAS